MCPCCVAIDLGGPRTKERGGPQPIRGRRDPITEWYRPQGHGGAIPPRTDGKAGYRAKIIVALGDERPKYKLHGPLIGVAIAQAHDHAVLRPNCSSAHPAAVHLHQARQSQFPSPWVAPRGGWPLSVGSDRERLCSSASNHSYICHLGGFPVGADVSRASLCGQIS